MTLPPPPVPSLSTADTRFIFFPSVFAWGLTVEVLVNGVRGNTGIERTPAHLVKSPKRVTAVDH